MLMNQMAANKVAAQRNAVQQAETARQAELQAKANAVNDSSQAALGRPQQEADLANFAAKQNAAYNANAADGSKATNPAGQGAPMVVNSDLGSRIQQALAYGSGLAKAKANMGAYGATQQNNGFTLNRAGIDLGQIGDASNRSSDITGLELEAANRAGSTQRGLADIFRMGGNGLLTYGMMQPAKAAVPTQAQMAANQGPYDWGL